MTYHFHAIANLAVIALMILYVMANGFIDERAKRLHDASWDNALRRFTISYRPSVGVRVSRLFTNPYEQFYDARLNGMVILARVLFAAWMISFCWDIYVSTH